VTKVEKESVSSKTISFRNFKAVEKDAFAADLRELSIETDNVDNFAEQFEDEVKRVLDIHAPLQDERIISRPQRAFGKSINIRIYMINSKKLVINTQMK